MVCSRDCRWVVSLFYNSHFVYQAFAVAELLYNEEHVSDIYVYATLLDVVKVYVTTERFPVAVECKAYELAT